MEGTSSNNPAEAQDIHSKGNSDFEILFTDKMYQPFPDQDISYDPAIQYSGEDIRNVMPLLSFGSQPWDDMESLDLNELFDTDTSDHFGISAAKNSQNSDYQIGSENAVFEYPVPTRDLCILPRSSTDPTTKVKAVSFYQPGQKRSAESAGPKQYEFVLESTDRLQRQTKRQRAVSQLAACLRCRLRKTKCTDNDPCERCATWLRKRLELESTLTTKTLPCIRTKLTDVPLISHIRRTPLFKNNIPVPRNPDLYRTRFMDMAVEVAFILDTVRVVRPPLSGEKCEAGDRCSCWATELLEVDALKSFLIVVGDAYSKLDTIRYISSTTRFIYLFGMKFKRHHDVPKAFIGALVEQLLQRKTFWELRPEHKMGLLGSLIFFLFYLISLRHDLVQWVADPFSVSLLLNPYISQLDMMIQLVRSYCTVIIDTSLIGRFGDRKTWETVQRQIDRYLSLVGTEMELDEALEWLAK